MNLVLANDNITSDYLDALAPHKSMLSLNQPRKLTSIARMPKPVASTISSWIHTQEQQCNDPAKLAFMQSLCV